MTESCPWASLPHFYFRLHKQSFPCAQPCYQIWWRNDKCPLSIHKSWTYYSPSPPFVCTHTHTAVHTFAMCASAVSASWAPCSLNLAVVKVHRGSSLTSRAQFVIDRGSLSSDLRQRIRGITSFEWFDATRPGSVLLYAATLGCDAAWRLGASITTLRECLLDWTVGLVWTYRDCFSCRVPPLASEEEVTMCGRDPFHF